MQTAIKEAEIKEAIRQYMVRTYFQQGEYEFDIEFKATRGDDGATAEIEVTPKGYAPAKAEPVKREVVKAETPEKSKPEPVAKVEAVEPTLDNDDDVPFETESVKEEAVPKKTASLFSSVSTEHVDERAGKPLFE